MSEDEKISMTTYDPHKVDKEEVWIFPDSKFLPLEVEFAGEVEKRSKSGTNVIPCLKFLGNGNRYYLSLWSKPVITSVLKSNLKCLIDVSKDKKVTVISMEQ